MFKYLNFILIFFLMMVVPPAQYNENKKELSIAVTKKNIYECRLIPLTVNDTLYNYYSKNNNKNVRWYFKEFNILNDDKVWPIKLSGDDFEIPINCARETRSRDIYWDGNIDTDTIKMIYVQCRQDTVRPEFEDRSYGTKYYCFDMSEFYKIKPKKHKLVKLFYYGKKEHRIIYL